MAFCTEDRRRMLLIVDEGMDDGSDIIVPARYEVCDTCAGKGTHVHRGVDGHGLSCEDFEDDPDFAEAYFRGDYDVACDGCGGARVVLTVDRDEAARQCPDHLAAWDARVEEEAAYEATCAAERRMGA